MATLPSPICHPLIAFSIFVVIVLVAAVGGLVDHDGHDRLPRDASDGVTDFQFVDCRKSTEQIAVDGLIGRHLAAIQIYQLSPGRIEFQDTPGDKLTIDVMKRAATSKGLNDVIVKHSLDGATDHLVLTLRVVPRSAPSARVILTDVSNQSDLISVFLVVCLASGGCLWVVAIVAGSRCSRRQRQHSATGARQQDDVTQQKQRKQNHSLCYEDQVTTSSSSAGATRQIAPVTGSANLSYHDQQSLTVNHGVAQNHSKMAATSADDIDRLHVVGSGGPSVNLGRSTQAVTLATMSLIIGLVTSTYAGCVLSRQTTDLVINLPSTLRIESAYIFSEEPFGSEIVTSSWTRSNSTKLYVIDDSAYLQDDGSCIAKGSCNLRQVSLAVDRDVKSCNTTLQKSLCSGSSGVHSNHCRAVVESCDRVRRYVRLEQLCPPSHLYDGTTCSVCHQCGRGMYEITPCHQPEYQLQRSCIHVAYPALQTNISTSLGAFVSELKVEASPNVFVENLHTARKLDTTYYVTAMKQQTDFFWYRDSGIRVNIGLQNINIMPVYDDVDHSGSEYRSRVMDDLDDRASMSADNTGVGADNDFILSNPNVGPEEKERFREIVQSVCRNPMPDYYSLTLEVARDRTTKTWSEICTQTAQRTGLCPPDVAINDIFYRRTLNEPCSFKEGQVPRPSPLQSAANSIVCTSSSQLLRHVFNITPPSDQPVTSSRSADCHVSSERCESCLKKSKCHHQNDFERECCLIDCHSSRDCKHATSEECREQPPQECATGDSYRFTLQPMFLRPGRSFRCHLRPRPAPDVLYQLWFYVNVKDASGFETSRLYATVSPSDITTIRAQPATTFGETGSTANGTTSTGSGDIDRFRLEFVTVEHSRGDPASGQDLIIRGRRRPHVNSGSSPVAVSDPASQWMFTARGVDDRKSMSKLSHFKADAIGDDVMVTSVDFSEPFAYSTSTWVAEGDDATETATTPATAACEKDVSKFLPVDVSKAERYNTEHSIGDEEDVNAFIEPNVDTGAYEYTLKSVRSPPYLRLSVPGNVSILRWWFRDKPASLVVDEVDLQNGNDSKTTQIVITGHVVDCPGYMSVTVNDRIESEEIGRFDVLVTCRSPASSAFFNVTLTVPPPSGSPVATVDKTLEVIIDDATSERRFYLNRFDLHRHRHQQQPVTSSLPSNAAATSFVAEFVSRDQEASLNPVTVTLLISAVITGIAAILFRMTVSLRQFKTKRMSSAFPCPPPPARSRDTTTASVSVRLSTRRRCLTVVYVVLWLSRCVLLTLTVSSLALRLRLDGDISVVGRSVRELFHGRSSLDGFSVGSHAAADWDVIGLAENEAKRRGKRWRAMRDACESYVDEMTEVVLNKIREFSSNNTNAERCIEPETGNELSAFVTYVDQVRRYSDIYRQTVDDVVGGALTQWRSYVGRLHRSTDWLQYPRSLFDLRQRRLRGLVQGQLEIEFAVSGSSSNDSSDTEMFGVFIDLPEIEALWSWNKTFLERFDRSTHLALFVHLSRTQSDAAGMESFPLQKPMTSQLCEARRSDQLMSNVSENTTEVRHDDLFDTIRFFVSVDQPSSSDHDDQLCHHQRLHTSKSVSGSTISGRRSCPSPEQVLRRSRPTLNVDLTSPVRWNSALLWLLVFGVDILLVIRRLIGLYFRLSMWRPPSKPTRSTLPPPAAPYSVASLHEDDDKLIPAVGLTDLGGRNLTARSRSAGKRPATGDVELPQTERTLVCRTTNGRLAAINGRGISELNGKHSFVNQQRFNDPASVLVNDQQTTGSGVDFYQINCPVSSPVNCRPVADDTVKSTMTSGLTRFYDVGHKNKKPCSCCSFSCCCCCCCNMLTVLISGGSTRNRNESSSLLDGGCSTSVVPRLVVMAAVLAGLFYARMMTSVVVSDGGVLKLLHGGAEPVFENGRHFDDLQRKYALDDVISSTSNDVLHLQTFVEFFNHAKGQGLSSASTTRSCPHRVKCRPEVASNVSGHCDRSLNQPASTTRWNIPMLPCNLIPQYAHIDADDEEIARVFNSRRRELVARSNALADSLESLMTSLLDTVLASLLIYVALGLTELILQASLSNTMTSLAGIEVVAKHNGMKTEQRPRQDGQVKFRGFLPLQPHQVQFKAKDDAISSTVDSSTVARLLLPMMKVSDHTGADHLIAGTSSRSCSPSIPCSNDHWMTSNSSLTAGAGRSTNFSETKV